MALHRNKSNDFVTATRLIMISHWSVTRLTMKHNYSLVQTIKIMKQLYSIMHGCFMRLLFAVDVCSRLSTSRNELWLWTRSRQQTGNNSTIYTILRLVASFYIGLRLIFVYIANSIRYNIHKYMFTRSSVALYVNERRLSRRLYVYRASLVLQGLHDA